MSTSALGYQTMPPDYVSKMQDYQQQANQDYQTSQTSQNKVPTVFSSFHSELAGGNKVLRSHIDRIEQFLGRVLGQEPASAQSGGATIQAPGDLASSFRFAIGEKTDLTERLGAAVKRLEALA